MPTFKTNMRMKFPKFNFTEDMKQIADRVIIPDIHGKMFNGVDINGRSYGSLAVSTKKIRTRKAQGFTPLKATGQMRAAIHSIIRETNKVFITLRNRRKDAIGNIRLAEILQLEGVKSKKHGRRKFFFFAISKEAEREGVKYMADKINRMLKSG